MQSQFVQVESFRLHYLEAGAENPGPPIVLLHGWPTHSYLYRKLIPSLAVEHRVIALDLPGFGQSDKPEDASYSFPFQERMFEGFLDALGLDAICLVVHDLGGPVGLYWAVHHLPRLRRLAILNTITDAFNLGLLWFVPATLIPGLNGLLATPRGVEVAMKLGTSQPLSDADMRAYQAPVQEKSAQRVLLRTVRRLHPGGLRTVSRRLSEIKVPTTLFYGENDRILPGMARTMRRIQKKIPHATMGSAIGAGHFLQEDAPERLSEHLLDFFRAEA